MFERRAIHVVPQSAPVVLVAKELPQPVKGLLGVPTNHSPGLIEPVDRGGLQGAQHSKLTVEIVQLVQFLCKLHKVRQGVGSRPHVVIL